MRGTCALVVWLILAGLLLAQETSPPTAAEIAKLIEQLDANEFNTREAASAALLKMGNPAQEALQQAVKTTSSAEVKTRAARVLEQLRIEQLRKSAFKLDAVYQLARDICDKKAEPADLEPVLKKILDTISTTNGDALVANPVRLADCTPGGEGPGGLQNKLLINQSNIAHLVKSAAILDAGGQISHARDSIIVAWGAVDIGQASNSIVIAGSDVKISHAFNSVIISGGTLNISDTHHCTLGSAEVLEPGLLFKACYVVNANAPVGGRVIPREGGEVTELQLPGLILRERPVVQNLLKDKITPTTFSEKLMLFRTPEHPGEFVVRLRDELLDVDGKPIAGLEGWKLAFVTRDFAMLENGDKRALVRPSPQARGE